MQFDADDREARRRLYRESMIGVNRPQNASKKSASAVDGLVQAVQNQAKYEALAIGDDASARSASHWAARAKDRRKALLRIIGRMEYANEETALMEEIIQHAVMNCVPIDGEAQVRLDNLMNELRDVRQKAKDREQEA